MSSTTSGQRSGSLKTSWRGVSRLGSHLARWGTSRSLLSGCFLPCVWCTCLSFLFPCPVKKRLNLLVTYQFDGVELILKLFVFFAGDSVLDPVDVEVFALLFLFLVLLELLKRFFPIAKADFKQRTYDLFLLKPANSGGSLRLTLGLILLKVARISSSCCCWIWPRVGIAPWEIWCGCLI